MGYKHLHHTYRDYKGCTSITNGDIGNQADLETIEDIVGYSLVNLFFPLDGSSVGYSTVCYARSQSSTNPKFFQSKISGSRCKISNLSVPDNKLAGTNLAAKIAITIDRFSMQRPLPEPSSTDQGQKMLKLIVRWSRMVKGICTKYSFVTL